MTVVETTVDIWAPIDTVFREITDPRRAAEWNANIIEVRDVTLPVREGTSWTQVMRVPGRVLTLQCRIARYNPPTMGELEVRGDQTARIVTRCDSIGAMTRVSHVVDFVPPGGALGALARGVMRTMLQRDMEQAAERQRQTLERESGGHGGSRA